MHALLECTTWHAVQHLRRVCALLEGVGMMPDSQFNAEDYEGLPMPAALW